MDLDRLASLAVADRRLTDLGHPRGVITKGGSIDLQAAALADDIAKRTMALCAALSGRIEGRRERIEANGEALAELAAADLANRISMMLSRPTAGSA
jgi:hypothetical protein